MQEFVVTSGSVSGDRKALMDLYEATGGDGWLDSSGWGSSDPKNSWHGVEVDGEGRVVRLDLRDNNLRGSLPESIGDLTRLRYINLKQNRLTGEIPYSIGNWSQLEVLYLSGKNANHLPDNPQKAYHPGKSSQSGNNFSGEFPDVWANYKNLEVFQLSGSSMSNILYDSIGECTELRQIVIAWNIFYTGKIPVTINNLTKLQRLLLRANAMTGSLPSMNNLKDLRFLHVGNGNALTGQLPDFRNNTKLRSINLDEQILNDGGFTGDWPHYWNNGEFTNLIGIRATHNKFTGTLHGFENLNLRTFAIDGNNLQGEIPKSISTNNELIILGLGWNNFNGKIPQSGWDAHHNTRYIRFAHNKLKGPIPDQLPNSGKLQYLYFEGNNLSGPVSTNHGKYANSNDYPVFRYMNISDNDFIPSEYQDLLDILGKSKLITKIDE